MSLSVDVVFLSKADTEERYRMTKRAIETCVQGAPQYDLNMIVIEQAPQRAYADTTTVYRPGEFNFNAFANEGARMGRTPWLVIATNDLEFEDGWLKALFAAHEPVVSPIDPGASTQADINTDTGGWVKSRHFSGWCFMMRRDIWEQIGGFDERVRFWCSDDAVVEQLKAIDVQPVVVVASRVHHRVSATLRDEPDQDELTWKQVYVFNQLYNQRLGEDNDRYREWMRRNGLEVT